MVMPSLLELLLALLGWLMVVRRTISLLLVLVLLVGSVRSSYATVATGAATDRGVWTLTASGAAKLGLAEAQVAKAVRILGMLGRVGSAVTVGIVAYEVASGLWDWWTATYDQGAAFTMTEPTGPANFGIQSGSGVGDCNFGLRQTSPGGVVYWTSLLSSCPGGGSFAGYTVVGQSYSASIDAGGWLNGYYTYHFVSTSTLPVGSTSHAASTSDGGRVALTSALDAAKLELTTLSSADLEMVSTQTGQVSPFTGSTLGGLTGILDAARNAVSHGVALTPSDVVLVNPGASTGIQPGEIAPGTTATEAPAIDLSGVTSAVSAIGSAITAAIAASQAAVVSAVSAVTTAVQAIPAAIAASQAAVVLAVNSVVSAITGVQTAVEGVGAKVDALKAVEEAANNTPASSAGAFVCTSCTRTEAWTGLMQSWQAAAVSAPIFGLISRLAWPGAGTVQRTWTLGTWQGNMLSVDLDASGIGTAITVVRFVVIGGAVILAYMIIFA